MTAVTLWTSPSAVIALHMVDDDLVRRDSLDGGDTWGTPIVVATGITGFTAVQRPPPDDRIQILTWVDYMRDRTMDLFYIRPVD